jgi:hypothetical protein
LIKRLLAIMAGLISLLAIGCSSGPDGGWSSGSTYDTSLRTIAVPVFGNATSDRKLSQNLTEAVVKEIESITPWKVTGQGRADTMLRGTVTRYRLILLSKDPTTGLANEMLVEATVDFEWVDLRTGEPILTRAGFAASALFTPSRPSQQPVDIGRFEVVQVLARDIVDTLQADW